jgi:hypothetical protein
MRVCTSLKEHVRTGCDTTSQGAKAWVQASSQASFGAFVVLLCSSLLCLALPAPKSPMFVCHTSHILLNRARRSFWLWLTKPCRPTGAVVSGCFRCANHIPICCGGSSENLEEASRRPQLHPCDSLDFKGAVLCIIMFRAGINHHNPTPRSLA